MATVGLTSLIARLWFAGCCNGRTFSSFVSVLVCSCAKHGFCRIVHGAFGPLIYIGVFTPEDYPIWDYLRFLMSGTW